jgi:hypothetical protein
MKINYYLFIFLLCLTFSAQGQEKDKKPDSTAVGYQKIEKYSEKNKFTSYFHKLIFKSTRTKSIRPKSDVIEKNFAAYEGKIIRTVSVVSLDPFGFSIQDIAIKPKHSLEKIGNSIHFKTKSFAILNLLLIKKNKPLDSLLVKESERLIRNQRFIRSVSITAEFAKTSSDSVDITIYSLDSWSLIPNGAITPSRVTYELNNRNFLGSGHQWDNTYRENLNNSSSSFSSRYSIPSFKNTFITGAIYYQIDFDENYNKGIQIDRTFFSPYTRWAGGALIENRFQQDSLSIGENTFVQQNFNFDTFDLWGGHSIPFFQKQTNRTELVNFVSTLRYLKVHYNEKPTAAIDPEGFYRDEDFWLTGQGISTRRYVKDAYIFNYGITEDVPIGKYYGINAGYQNKNNIKRAYFGLKATLGDYFKWGYFSSNFEYGSFFRGSAREQGAFVAQINYFTPLFEPGEWKIRQFFKANVVLGENRLAIRGDQISINENNGILGLNDPNYLGTKKLVFSFQTQSYSPWNLAGFRLNPFFNYSLAFLGNESKNFKESKGFSKIGFGFLISNDYLVFSTFQLSFAYYPRTPEGENNLIKSNTFKTNDFGYLDFEINNPRTVLYE